MLIHVSMQSVSVPRGWLNLFTPACTEMLNSNSRTPRNGLRPSPSSSPIFWAWKGRVSTRPEVGRWRWLWWQIKWETFLGLGQSERNDRDFKVNNFEFANFPSFIRFLHGAVTQKLRIDSEFMDYGVRKAVFHFTSPVHRYPARPPPYPTNNNVSATSSSSSSSGMAGSAIATEATMDQLVNSC